MFNIDELVMYLIIIVGLIFVIHMYNQMYPKASPIWEGITNSKDTKTNKKESGTETGTGYTVGAVGFNEDIVGLISVLDGRLKISKYSEDYMEILTNLKELYAKKALSELLSDSKNPEWKVNVVAVYKNGIEGIEKIITELSLSSSSSGSGMPSFGSKSKSKSKSKKGKAADDEEDDDEEDDDEEDAPKSWSPW